MSGLRVLLDGSGAWPDLDAAKREGRVTEIVIGQVAALPGCLPNGETLIAFRLDLPDGQIVIAEVPMAALSAAVGAFVARYGAAPARPRLH